MDNQVEAEIKSLDAQIAELKASKSAYMQQYESAPDNMKHMFLELTTQVEKQATSLQERIVQLERQKTILIERTLSPSDFRPIIPATYEDSHEVYNSWKKRVFLVTGDKEQGSGVLISNKRILTAAHMSFQIDKTYNVSGTEGSFEVKCIFICKKFDFAVLTSESLPEAGTVPRNIRQGDEYFLMGYPDGADHSEPTITRGFIKGVMNDCIHLIGTPGSRRGFSGGPILYRGSVAGILLGGLHPNTINVTVQELLDSSVEQRYGRILQISNIKQRFNGVQFGRIDREHLQTFEISQMHRHENFSDSSMNNVALVQLKDLITFGPDESPICLHKDYGSISTNEMFLTARWGFDLEITANMTITGDIVLDKMSQIAVFTESNIFQDMMLSKSDEIKECIDFKSRKLTEENLAGYICTHGMNNQSFKFENGAPLMLLKDSQ